MNTKTKTRTIPGIIIGILILLALLYVSMYFSTNKESLDKLTSPSASPSLTPTMEEELSLETEMEVEISDIADKKLVFFNDKDFDQTKVDAEPKCDVCKNMSILAARDSMYTASSSLKSNNNAELSIADTNGLNLIWGLFTDKSLMILPTRFELDDGAGDIEVPVWTYTAMIAGVNANIVSVQEAGENLTLSFTRLIPMMKSAYEARKPIWIKITPNINSLDKYILLPGTMSLVGQEYDYLVSIPDSAALAAAKKEANIEFLVF